MKFSPTVLSSTALLAMIGLACGSQQAATAGPVPVAGGKAAYGIVVPDTNYKIPEERLTLFQPGVTYNGGIPKRTTICASLTPSGGDDTTAIQDALDSCADGGVVSLGEGTFSISGEGIAIKTSGVTLRGAGAGKTILKQSSSDYPVIIIGLRWYKWVDQVELASDAPKGGVTFTLKSNPGIKKGEILVLNEKYDSEQVWYNPERQTGDFLGWGEGRKGAMSESRPLGQMIEVEKVSGNEITTKNVFHSGYRTTLGAHVARIGNNGGERTDVVRNSGIEYLTVTGGGGGDGGGNIRYFATAYCWAKGIESTLSKGASFAFDGAYRSEIRDSFLHESVNPNPGGEGYGVAVDSYTSDSLVENNVVMNFNKVIVMRSSGGGNVVGYNYMEDAYGEGYPTIPEVGLNAAHMAGSHHELFEGNQCFNFGSDSVWGNSIYIVGFRNHLTTLRRSLPGVKVELKDEVNRRGIEVYAHHWWYSFVGNVIGYPDGYLADAAVGHTYPPFTSAPTTGPFIYEANSESGAGTKIWMVGLDQNNVVDDLAVERTLRDGNYDYFTKKSNWHGIGGSGKSKKPSEKPLPNSYYLKEKPAFFGSLTWPWVDGSSEDTPLPGTLPARTRFDANAPNVAPE